MTATTIRQAEALPADYPDAPLGLSAAAAALDPAVIWQRIESYVAWRWSARDVMWIATGPGEWTPPLKPAAITTTEFWNGSGWETATPDPSPLEGFELHGYGPYRFTASVGADDDVPAVVNEAFRRLAEYMAARLGTPGASLERLTIFDVSSRETIRSESWMALALQNSGAADLLRPYRKV
jgi:hypothetical protein